MLWSKKFWQATIERSISTVAQCAAALVSAKQVSPITDLGWGWIAGVSATAGVLSLLKSLAASQMGNGGPSLVLAEGVTDAR